MKEVRLRTNPEWKEQNFAFLAPNGCNYNSPTRYLSSVIGLCGCASDSIEELAVYLMKKMYEARINDTSFYYEYKDKTELEQDHQELMLHMLGHADLTEHGSAVRGSWLTDKGVEMCKILFEVI